MPRPLTWTARRRTGGNWRCKFGSSRQGETCRSSRPRYAITRCYDECTRGEFVAGGGDGCCGLWVQGLDGFVVRQPEAPPPMDISPGGMQPGCARHRTHLITLASRPYFPPPDPASCLYLLVASASPFPRMMALKRPLSYICFARNVRGYPFMSAGWMAWT